MALMPDYLHMAPVSHGTSACASSAFAPPTTNKIGAMGAMVPAYFSMTLVTVYAKLLLLSDDPKHSAFNSTRTRQTRFT